MNGVPFFDEVLTLLKTVQQDYQDLGFVEPETHEQIASMITRLTPIPCPHTYTFNPYCGAQVCEDCDHHKGLVRCFCGWAISGGDGRAELVEMGETIDPEDY